MAAALRRQVSNASLELEITETLLLGDSHSSWRRVALKARPVNRYGRFGTCYSSLSYLWRFPSTDRIDRSFSKLRAADRDAATVKAISRSTDCHMRVTVEGVRRQTGGFLRGPRHQVQVFFSVGHPRPGVAACRLRS